MINITFLKTIGIICLTLGCLTSLTAEEDDFNDAITGILTQEIIDKQPQPTKIRKELYQRAFKQPLKTTYELVPTYEGLDFSLAITDFIETTPHYHLHLSETYTIVYGTVEVFVDEKSYILNPGDVIVVPINSVHWARSVNGKLARMIVSCIPGWTPEDNHLVKEHLTMAEHEEIFNASPCTAMRLNDHVITNVLQEETEKTPSPLKEVAPHLYQRSFEMFAKMLIELIPAYEGLGFSLALIDLGESETSHYLGRSEVYTVISGTVEVCLNDQFYYLHRGDVIAIPLYATHWMRSNSEEQARVLVSCIPGFSR